MIANSTLSKAEMMAQARALAAAIVAHYRAQAPAGCDPLNSLSNEFETSLLGHIFQNAAAANVGDVTGLRGSTTAGVFYIGLHTGDPGEAGDQTTNEAGYTSYARVAVNRDGTSWTVSGNSASNAAAVTFPACSGSSSTVTYFSIGTASSGAGHLICSGALTSSLAVSTGITPSFAIGQLTVTAD